VLRNDISLAHNTHLRSIVLTILEGDGCYSRIWLFTLLSQIVSPHMVHVSLRFRLEDISALDTIDWTQIEQVFTQHQWTNLQMLTISCRVLSEIGEVDAGSIRARLPVLESRGVLCV
jgi:hypothetical protein